MKDRRYFIRTLTLLTAGFWAKAASGGFFPEIKPDKEGVYIINRAEHSMAEIAAAIAEIPPITYLPVPMRWLNLTKTQNALTQKNSLNIVMLGDSIVNDTYRSAWYQLLEKGYPNCRINATAVVRGNTGCWWYKQKGRVKHYVTPLNPDLVIIGGISQKNDIRSIQKVIRQLRKTSSCDILLMTDVFGKTDPNDDRQWTFDIPQSADNYRRGLYNLSIDSHSAFIDLNAYWGRYIRQSGKPIEWFKRDEVHANIRGEQVIGHLLADQFLPVQKD